MKFKDLASEHLQTAELVWTHLTQRVPLEGMDAETKTTLVAHVCRRFEDEFRLNASKKNLAVLTKPEVSVIDHGSAAEITVSAVTVPMLG